VLGLETVTGQEVGGGVQGGAALLDGGGELRPRGRATRPRRRALRASRDRLPGRPVHCRRVGAAPAGGRPAPPPGLGTGLLCTAGASMSARSARSRRGRCAPPRLDTATDVSAAPAWTSCSRVSSALVRERWSGCSSSPPWRTPGPRVHYGPAPNVLPSPLHDR